jgi:hypothetical protein
MRAFKVLIGIFQALPVPVISIIDPPDRFSELNDFRLVGMSPPDGDETDETAISVQNILPSLGVVKLICAVDNK